MEKNKMKELWKFEQNLIKFLIYTPHGLFELATYRHKMAANMENSPFTLYIKFHYSFFFRKIQQNLFFFQLNFYAWSYYCPYGGAWMAKFSHKNRSILYRIINNIPGHGALVKSRWLVWAPNGLYSANSRWIPVGPYWVHMARKCPRWSINMGAYFCPGDPRMDLIWAQIFC